jgi:hypothetical protein
MPLLRPISRLISNSAYSTCFQIVLYCERLALHFKNPTRNTLSKDPVQKNVDHGCVAAQDACAPFTRVLCQTR